MNADWRRVGENLKVEDHVIDNICLDHRIHVKERAYQMLIAWTQKAYQPKLKTLLQALEKAGLSQLVEDISGDIDCRSVATRGYVVLESSPMGPLSNTRK
jgi:hypothetical protein